MLNMRIEGIEIRNYRVFRQAVIKDLSRLTALVGANGSGKSTLFDVFSFLKDALAHNVAKAVNKRGGFRELVSRGETGPIAIALKFRETGGRLATYELSVASDGGLPVVEREILRFRRGQRGKPWRFVDFFRAEKAKYRDPDTLPKPSSELGKLVPEFQKLAGARRLGLPLSEGRNRSQNFGCLVSGVRRLVLETASVMGRTS